MAYMFHFSSQLIKQSCLPFRTELRINLNSNFKQDAKLQFEFKEVEFPVAQTVEHSAIKAKVMGSIPRESKIWLNVNVYTLNAMQG